MRILLALHHFLPRYTGGVELIAQRAAHWLVSHGHQVEIVCVEAIDRGDGLEVSAQSDEYEGLPVQRLSFNLAAQGDIINEKLILAYGLTIVEEEKLNSLLAKRKYITLQSN